MKKHYKNNKMYALPEWYKNLMYQLGFRKINDTGREYYVNLISGEPCRVNKSGRLRSMRDGATADTYGRVRLKMSDGTYKTCYTHRLIADYIPNRENKPQVNHIKVAKNCNGIAELEWATARENRQHYIQYQKNKEETNEHNSN